MRVEITWLGIDCAANYGIENGQNIVSTIEIGDQVIRIEDASMAVNDEIHALVDSAVRGYVDNTHYFGEQI